MRRQGGPVRGIGIELDALDRRRPDQQQREEQGRDMQRIDARQAVNDELAIVDANYPAASSGRPVIRADGSQVPAVAAAVLSLMPLDEFVPCAAFHMQVVDNPGGQMPIFEEFRALLRKYEPRMAKLEGIERFAFYERVKKCYAVVATGERRLYGNLILKKGIVRPD